MPFGVVELRLGNVQYRSIKISAGLSTFPVMSEIRCAFDASSSGQICQRIMKVLG